MTEIAVSQPRTVDTASDAAARRLRSRYRSEARFKAYGIAAIIFAAAFLVALIADIVGKALPAFTVSYVQIEVTPTLDNLGVTNLTEPTQIQAANFMAPVREALAANFPAAAEARRTRQQLYGLLSNNAAAEVRERLLADPNLIGKPITVRALLSDDADLFVKGVSSAISESVSIGTAQATGTTGTITIRSSASDFNDEVVAIKRTLSEEASRLRGEVGRFSALVGEREAELREMNADIAAAQQRAPDTVPVLEGQRDALAADVEGLKSLVAERQSQAQDFQARFDAVGGTEKLTNAMPSLLVAINGGLVKATSLASDRVEGEVLLPLSSTEPASAGAWKVITYETPQGSRKLTDQEIAWLDKLDDQGAISTGFNWAFFTTGDSREAELAGILGALAGSALTMLVTLAICLPVGVASAIYLEEFAPKNRITDIIEININNLAAVPSIVFGLLGLAVFLGFFGMPRSAPLVGGLVLALLVLPTIIIASRAALRAVPPSIREAALGVGASHQQAVFHHVLPLAMPGILTGTIIGMAHALGETAPLLMIGMVAFIVDIPGGVTQAATALPVQIYLWSDLPEVGFQAKTAAAILVLLAFLFAMNGMAILLRKTFERRW
jgi:phosphate transport system permease protein